MSNPFVISFFLSSTLFIRVAHSLPPQHNGVASDTAISKKTFKIPEVIITKKTPQSYLKRVTKICIGTIIPSLTVQVLPIKNIFSTPIVYLHFLT